MMQSYAVNLLWDANQAIRFGIEWMRIFNTFNGNGPAPTVWDQAVPTGPGNSISTDLQRGISFKNRGLIRVQKRDLSGPFFFRKKYCHRLMRFR